MKSNFNNICFSNNLDYVKGLLKYLEDNGIYVDYTVFESTSYYYITVFSLFIKELLKMFTKEKDIVLDPLVGSGGVPLVCV